MSGSYMPMNHSYSPEYNEQQESDGYGQQYERYVSLTPSPSESFSDDMQNKTWFAPSKYSSFTISSNEKERNGDVADYSSESSRERIQEPLMRPRVSPTASKYQVPTEIPRKPYNAAAINAKQNGGLFCFDLSGAGQEAKDKASMSKSQSNISNTRNEVSPSKDDKRQYSRSKTAELSASAQTMAKLRKLTSSKTLVTEISPSKSNESTINHLKDDNYDDMKFTVESSYDTPSKPKGILYSSRNKERTEPKMENPPLYKKERTEPKKENSPLYKKEVSPYTQPARVDRNEPIIKKELSPLFRDVPAYAQPKNFHDTRTISPMKSPKHIKPVEYPFPIEERRPSPILPKIDPVVAKKPNGFPEFYQMPEVQVAPPRAQSILNLTTPQVPPKLLNVLTLTPSKFSVSDGLPLKQQSPQINGSTKSLFIETASLKNQRSTGYDEQSDYKGRDTLLIRSEKSISPPKDDFKEIITGIISKKEAELNDELKSLKIKSNEEIQNESAAIEERLAKLKEREKSISSELRFHKEKDKGEHNKLKSPVIEDFKGFIDSKEANKALENEKSLDTANQLRSKREVEWSKKKTELVENTEETRTSIIEKSEKSMIVKSSENETITTETIKEQIINDHEVTKTESIKQKKTDIVVKSEQEKEVESLENFENHEKLRKDDTVSEEDAKSKKADSELEEPKQADKVSLDSKKVEKIPEEDKPADKEPEISNEQQEVPKKFEKVNDAKSAKEPVTSPKKSKENTKEADALKDKGPKNVVIEKKELLKEPEEKKKVPTMKPKNSFLNSLYSKKIAPLMDSTEPSKPKKLEDSKSKTDTKKEIDDSTVKPKNSLRNSLFSRSKTSDKKDEKAPVEKKDEPTSRMSLRNSLKSTNPTVSQRKDKAEDAEETSESVESTAKKSEESNSKKSEEPTESPPAKRSPRSKTARPASRKPLPDEAEKVEDVKTNKEALANLRTGLKSTKTENLAESINDNLKRSPSMPSLAAAKHLRSKSSPRECPKDSEPESSPASKHSSLISARKSRLFGATTSEKNGSVVSLHKSGSSASLLKSNSAKNSSLEEDEAPQKPKESAKLTDDIKTDKKPGMAKTKPAEVNDSSLARKPSLKSTSVKTSSTSQNSSAKQEDATASKATLDEKKLPEQTKSEKPSILKKPTNFAKIETSDEKSNSSLNKTTIEPAQKTKNPVEKIENPVENDNEKIETNETKAVKDVQNNDNSETPSKSQEVSSQELIDISSNSDNFISSSESTIAVNNEPKKDSHNNKYSPEVNSVLMPYKEKLAALEKEVKEMNNLFRNLNSMCSTTSKDENIIKLNIGGTIYQTHKSTLTAPIKKYPDENYEPHLLQLLVTGQIPCGSDENGAIFIDKNSLYFSYVMDYLRNNAAPDLFPFDLPRKEDVLKGIIKESEYFKLHGLTKSAKTLFKNLLIKNFRSSILNDEDKRRLIDLCNLTDRLELVYRASYHGFSAKEFHSKCDGISKTITIVKTSKNNIFGGYTEAAWSKNKSYSSDRSAYIFSLVNKDPKDNKAIQMKCLQPERAIYNHPDHGPTFGSGYDFLISNNSDQNEDSLSYLGNSYKHPKWIKNSAEAKQFLGGSFHFRTTEIEVFSME